MDRRIIRFGAFAFDADTRQLTRGGEAIHLSPKAFELLLILLRNRPRALSKSDLQSRLWPDTFVSESNLAGLVKELRRAMRDDPRHPRVIRTLHGFGYAFAGAVSDPAAAASDSRRPDVTFWLVGDRQVRLSPGDTVLGRDADATVWFDLPGISRLHARITVVGDGAVLEDLGSTNGTFVAGERLDAPRPLQDGDEIRLGPLRLTFRTRRASARTEVER
jgi:DNA-binding winged helix-turn-helix (wHTH) protein